MYTAIVIGSSPVCHVVVKDDYVSPMHMKAQYMDDRKILIMDMGSTNGTWVNNVRIYSPAILKSGDKLRIGRTTVVIP